MSFETSFQYLLKWEGGFGNNIHDAGGPTNLGVIQDEYDRYRDEKELPRQSVRYISKTEAQDIYKTKYWDVTRCGDFNEGVANCLFDGDVNSGDRRGVTWLQEAINIIYGSEVVVVDGKSGPQTIAAANGLAAHQLIDEMLKLRLAFMHIAKNSKTGELLWLTFGHGWEKRINGVRAQSHALCGVSVPQSPLIPSPIKKEKTMSDLAPILELAKVVAPILAPALESGNPLFGVAINLVSAALQTTSDALPATAATTSPGKLVTVLKAAEADLKAHAAAAAALTSPPPATPPSPTVAPQPPTAAAPADAPPASIYVDEVSSTAKYVLGVISVAIMVKMGMSVDVANGLAANIVPVAWTMLGGLLTTGMGWMLRRSISGSNAATEQLMKKS